MTLPFRSLLLFLIAAAPAAAQPRLGTVDITGNSFHSTRRLTDHLGLSPGQPVSPALVREIPERTAALYRADGFFLASVDSVVNRYTDDSSFVALHLYLTEGVRSLVARFTIAGLTEEEERTLHPRLASGEGEPFLPGVLEEDIGTVTDFLSERGFPFNKVRTDSVRTVDSAGASVSVALVVDRGPYTVIEELRVGGNTATRRAVIERAAGIETGTPFSDRAMERLRRRLQRTELFSAVSEPELYLLAPPDSGRARAGAEVTVTEGNVNTFDGILGYVPEAPSGSGGYLTGDIAVAFRNLFGTGRRTSVRWKRETAETQEWEIAYTEPWIAGLPFDVGVSLAQRKQDSSYVRSRWALSLGYPVTDEITLHARISSEAVFPPGDTARFTVFESGTTLFAAGLAFDSRNDRRNPSGGGAYSTTIETGEKRIDGPAAFLTPGMERRSTVRRLTLDAETYVPLLPRHVLLASLHGRQVTSSRIERSDLYPFGGTTTVRGYRENQFFGADVVWGTLEYRFLTGRASSLVAFVDGGYFRRPADAADGSPGQERSLAGYGLGARIETGLGLMTVSYALGEGDSFGTGKVHVGLENGF